jgi:8-oxo-dGTP pyrophosphatase MutT (NUDIX family)
MTPRPPCQFRPGPGDGFATKKQGLKDPAGAGRHCRRVARPSSVSGPDLETRETRASTKAPGGCLAGPAVVKRSVGLFNLSRLRQSLSPATIGLPALPPDLVPAGVLMPLFEQEGELSLLFTQRTLTVKDHQGQISFPGGVRDAQDPNLLATALREAGEEIGLDSRVVEVLGVLPPETTSTGYAITAFVGAIPYPYEFRPNPREVARLLLLPLAGFLPPERWSTGDYDFRGQILRVYCWKLNGEVIWGATARLLLHLLAALGHHPIPGESHATSMD